MGPRLSHFIATATIAISGKVNRMRALATIRLAMRFTPSLFETWSNPRGFGTAMVSDIVFAREELAGANSTARIPLMREALIEFRGDGGASHDQSRDEGAEE